MGVLVFIPLLPFLGFLFNATLGRRASKGVSGLVATGAMALAFLAAVAAVWQMLGSAPVGGVRAVEQTVYSWISSGTLRLPLTLRVDPLSALMILVVTGIGTLIHLYSTAYMHDETDAEFARYFSYLNLFAAFMLMLVLGASFPVMFIGWEGVGLCSYLLIGFWFTKPAAADAGKKAFIVNRIGDFGFILGMLSLFWLTGTLNFQGVAASSPSPSSSSSSSSSSSLSNSSGSRVATRSRLPQASQSQGSPTSISSRSSLSISSSASHSGQVAIRSPSSSPDDRASRPTAGVRLSADYIDRVETRVKA
jgi:NADH:ubiquinone oxidoreductase subunit 5 (subunit L)/multisubunit Na+/H+ antiporter MnhA subunit